MSCWGCFAQMAKNIERNRRERKERLDSYRNRKKSHRASIGEIHRIKIPEEDKQKLMKLISKFKKRHSTFDFSSLNTK